MQGRTASTDRREFGRRLRAAMKRTGVKFTAIAQRAGVSENAIYRWTVGEREPRACDLSRLCVVLNVSADDLLGIRKDSNDQ